MFETTIAALAMALLGAQGIEAQLDLGRSEIVCGEPLMMRVQVQNMVATPLEANRRRKMPVVLFVRELGEPEFTMVARGRHYREGYEVDGTDSWPPGAGWAWDEWFVRRTNDRGDAVGLLFDQPGDFEVKVAVRINFASASSNSWRDSNTCRVVVKADSGELRAEKLDRERTIQVLERGVRKNSWQEDMAALEHVRGPLSEYASFRIGEFYYSTTLWMPRESKEPSEFGSRAEVAQKAIDAYGKVLDRCPALRRRASFRIAQLLDGGYTHYTGSIDYAYLVEGAHLDAPLPRQPLDAFDIQKINGCLNRLEILFVKDARLDSPIPEWLKADLQWKEAAPRMEAESGLRISLPDSLKDRVIGNISNRKGTIRQWLFLRSGDKGWWAIRDGTLSFEKQQPEPPR